MKVLNFREMIIYNCKKFFLDNISAKYKAFFSNLFKYNIYQQTSKVLIEQVFIITIIIIFTFLIISNSQTNLNSYVPLLAVYLFAFLRILPSFNKIIMEFQSYISHKLFVNKVNAQFDIPKNLEQTTEIINFENEIEFKDVSYKFDESSLYVLKELNLIIKKNSKIGIIGKSGSGKTTFLNLLMGFLKPSKGEIIADGINTSDSFDSWRQNIAFVSQTIYLLDDTITKNICFEEDESKINFDLLEESLLILFLKSFIDKLPEGLNTHISEKIKISGGEILRYH